MSKTIKIFNTEIKTREHYCRFFDFELEEVESSYLNLYVRFNGCNANCLFCESHSNSSPTFNEEKYIECLNEIKSKILLNKISFTGGEPTLNFERLKRLIDITYEITPKTDIVISTNGYNIEKIYNDDNFISKVFSIALSRHHYLDEINNKILGFESILSEKIKEIQKNEMYNTKLHLTCNLIKGYIDSKEEIYKYLEFCNEVDVYDVGLVSLMEDNEYCKQNKIEFSDIELLSEKFHRTKGWSYKDMCYCSNYVYIPDNLKTDVVKLYHRKFCKPLDINMSLIYDGENLLSGFKGKIIY